ncbi:hypothetical protein MCAL160_0399 [Mycoplasmopsis californica HAZ160_1]|uniref:Uncharacterized protein n=1 Tax=Mycoplasmopsis californica HAZ160_1 TaxID=1397850 RepID=A0AAT9F7X1_9BACT|nr:ABC transporter permease [Mycoplasmopsis californica]BAP00997.1 hypothetical protein MCAL160_0399 [Mycoplasmopsis californica HAZ160_1]BBG40862.1 hypothetical protein MCAL106_0399 [Mycoplasmopsis californica]BBG41456.1 hypothetical protein MCAL106E_0399 [Mycoplasmopsis californica]BBG42049.1 hypothetical protein MCAL106L_0399 [Mycoplasmopsis californica]BBG42632.1 hypothetical protein MCAL160E_0399 [Mycoplasmopsis californica]
MNKKQRTRNLYKPYFKKIEKKKHEQIVSTKSLNFGIELIKFILFIFLMFVFVVAHYGTRMFGQNTGKIFMQFYLYSFGLAFGDLIWFVLIGLFCSLIINWLESILKRYYSVWVKNYTRVDYWLIRKRVKFWIYLTLATIAIGYHWYLLYQRPISSKIVYNHEDFKTFFTHGWYYSFTQSETEALKVVNATGNVGVFIDTILNILHIISVGPWFVLILMIAIQTLAWTYLLTLKPIDYLKNLTGSKTIPHVREHLKKLNTVFYYTPEAQRYLDYLSSVAKVLELDIETISMNKLLRLMKQNMDILSHNPLTSVYFIQKNKHKKNQTNNEQYHATIDEEILNQEELNEFKNNQHYTGTTDISIQNSQIQDENYLFNTNEENTTNLIFDKEADKTTNTQSLLYSQSQDIEHPIQNTTANNLASAQLQTNEIDKTREVYSIDTKEFQEGMTSPLQINPKAELHTDSMVLVMQNNTQNINENIENIDLISQNSSFSPTLTHSVNLRQTNDSTNSEDYGFVQLNTQEVELMNEEVKHEQEIQRLNPRDKSYKQGWKNVLENNMNDDDNWIDPF